ncbi:hypothetical protein Ddye_026137 [Dipteronia dyeriana]|uniref:Uncharacterized protein n=1 Tax=Dipteronia dyeriana TaxID=168575 RepID=A0AAD9WQ48_9ROSI|nr:hypothetical protein Ddye_026137 [Dipteronia dyeriana]
MSASARPLRSSIAASAPAPTLLVPILVAFLFRPCPCHHASDEPCMANAIGNLYQSFLLSYGVRVGIGILIHAFKLARQRSYSLLLDLKLVFSLLLPCLIFLQLGQAINIRKMIECGCCIVYKYKSDVRAVCHFTHCDRAASAADTAAHEKGLAETVAHVWDFHASAMLAAASSLQVSCFIVSLFNDLEQIVYSNLP